MPDVDFEYHCYRCGEKNSLPGTSCPIAPDYHHLDVTCSNCGDSTRVLLSHCPNPDCGRYVFWVNDMSIPELVQNFARYMVHNMQAMIDQAALKGVKITMDTPSEYPINATCPCGTQFSVHIPIPDLD